MGNFRNLKRLLNITVPTNEILRHFTPTPQKGCAESKNMKMFIIITIFDGEKITEIAKFIRFTMRNVSPRNKSG